MKILDLKNKGFEELGELLKERRGELLHLNFDLMEKKLKDVSRLGKIKKDIARILTRLNLIKKEKSN